MPAYRVVRSIPIAKKPEEINEFLADFTSWPSWSPWLIMEPECKVVFEGEKGAVGSSYHWTGNMVGEGKMTLLTKTPQIIDCDLEFIKPFKSHAKAAFHLKEEGEGTLVTWTLDANLPFFMFFLKKMMEQSLGMDYERGLKMLKSLIETGSIPSQLKLVGKRSQPAMHYVGIDQVAKIPQLSEIIPADFKKISQMLKEAAVESSGAPFTLYYSMDMDTGVNTLRNCIPVATRVDVAEPFVCESIQPCDTYVVQHSGAYQFVGNAWAFAMFAARHFKVKLKKKPVGYEYYSDDPETTEEKDLLTEIVLFAK